MNNSTFPLMSLYLPEYYFLFRKEIFIAIICPENIWLTNNVIEGNNPASFHTLIRVGLRLIAIPTLILPLIFTFFRSVEDN